jgi:hypothetical protein
VYLSKIAGRLFDPKAVAMLAEIFMMRSEAERRLVRQVLPSSTSHLIPFSPKSQFVFTNANHERHKLQSKSPVKLVR